jgi:hypothetical protein
MMTLKAAIKHAEAMEVLHGEPWLVFKTPDNAPINQGINALYNTGRFACCRSSEREDYADGGATFPTLPNRQN